MPAVIIPAPDALPLPAPVSLLQLLLQLTFLLHLLAMNAMLGGLLLTLVARVKGAGPQDPWTRLADAVAKVTPVLVAAAVTLGVAPLLFLQTLYGQFFFTSSILMGWGWFSVIVVLIFAYYGTYVQSFKGPTLGAARVPLLAVTALLFLWIGFMFSNDMSLMLNLQKWSELYFASPQGLHLNLADPQLGPRYLHMVSGAIAVSGLMLALWGQARHRRGDSSGAFMVTVGMTAFPWFTLVNAALGLWYYFAQPSPVRRLFMGGDGFATALFALAVVVASVLVIAGFLGRRKEPGFDLRPVSLLTVVQMITMIMMRDIVRRGHLGAHYRPGTFAVEPQVLNMVIFAGLLLGGAGVLVWMLRRLSAVWNR